ncbi:MAG: GGDEF domain-containing protein [Treponema sp.]|nr:GGDEF domain-containing protein [Treponema sp.]
MNIIYNEQKKFRILLLFFTSLAIILLSIIELIFINSINYREHVETIYDSLTNLWTRQKFEKEVDRIIKHSPKDKFMLIESDIKNFKYINQTYGNQKADELIIFYSKLLQESVKDFKGIVSRGYSDHFYILIRIYSIYRAKKAFLDQLETLNKEINKFEITFIPKFGITFLKPNIDYNQISIKNLIGQASFTKSLLEENTFSQYGIYSSILLDKIKEERYIENHMNLALENEDFFIMYQPIMDIQSDKIIGAKPVIKWKDPEHGLINEDIFMPIFKRNGFISNLEFFVYKKVFNFLQNQINEKSSLVPILLTVSKIDLNYVDFMNKFSKLFLQYSIVPELIEIDLPEQVIFNQPQTNDLINFFHKLNIQIAVSDSSSCDFSLKTLHSKEIDVIKFNKNFIKIFESNDFDKSSLEFINYFLTECKNLKKRTIFTGIDNQSQDEILRELNCDYAQGDYYSRPLSESDFIQFIKLKF